MIRNDGILEVTLNSKGGSLVWGVKPHRELPRAFADIAADRENRIVILTGAGESFCDAFNATDEVPKYEPGTPDFFDNVYWEGKKLLENLLAIEVPVIGVVNGPARFHAELPVLSDVVLASDTAVFQDKPHFASGLVPGDGSQLVWETLIGVNRARYFLLTAQELSVHEAKAMGVVAEVLPRGELMARARNLAAEMARKPTLALRYTRVVFVHRLRRLIPQELGYGLSLEMLALR